MTPYLQLLHALGVTTQEEAMAEIGRLHGYMLSIERAPAAHSRECDFEAGTWTFEPVGRYEVRAGMYALVPMIPRAVSNG